ncbi:Acyl-CoA dehydrogenase family member 10, partial [Frankliniella fusca]
HQSCPRLQSALSFSRTQPHLPANMKVLVAVLLVALVAPALSAPAPEPAPKPSGGVVLLNGGLVPASTLVVGPGGGIVSTSGLVPVSSLGLAGHPTLLTTHGGLLSPLVLA